MHATLRPSQRVERPRYALVAAALEVFTAVGAIPIGIAFLRDPTGRAVGLHPDWIEATVFGSYLVPGLYLVFVNGVAMLLTAALTDARHWLAPWLTAVLGAGLVIWILVQVQVLPETSMLQVVYLGVGGALVAIGLAWLRRTGQLRLTDRWRRWSPRG